MSRMMIWTTLGVCALLSACDFNGGRGDAQQTTEAKFRADVVRTEYGIPHITAEDFGSFGYG